MTKIKLVSSDVDGTLLESSQKMSQYTKDVIEQLQDNGILFGLASGRPIYQLRRTIKLWNLKYYPDFIIGMNGSELYDNQDKTITNYSLLSANDLKNIIDYMSPFMKRTNIYMYYHNEMIYAKYDAIYLDSKRKYENIEKVNLVSLEQFYSEPNAKILFRLYDEKDMPILEEYIKNNPRKYFAAYKTQPNLMEFTHPNTNKGAALKEYAKKYAISRDEIAAFGDTSNDNSMLKQADMSVCMENGSDDTKRVAKYITESNVDEDGWAKFVSKYILRP